MKFTNKDMLKANLINNAIHNFGECIATYHPNHRNYYDSFEVDWTINTKTQTVLIFINTYEQVNESCNCHPEMVTKECDTSHEMTYNELFEMVEEYDISGYIDCDNAFIKKILNQAKEEERIKKEVEEARLEREKEAYKAKVAEEQMKKDRLQYELLKEKFKGTN